MKTWYLCSATQLHEHMQLALIEQASNSFSLSYSSLDAEFPKKEGHQPRRQGRQPIIGPTFP